MPTSNLLKPRAAQIFVSRLQAGVEDVARSRDIYASRSSAIDASDSDAVVQDIVNTNNRRACLSQELRQCRAGEELDMMGTALGIWFDGRDREFRAGVKQWPKKDAAPGADRSRERATVLPGARENW